MLGNKTLEQEGGTVSFFSSFSLALTHFLFIKKKDNLKSGKCNQTKLKGGEGRDERL